MKNRIATSFLIGFISWGSCGFSQIPKDNCEEFWGVSNTLDEIRSHKNEVYTTLHLKRFFDALNKSFDLKLVIQYEMGKSINVTAPNKKSFQTNEFLLYYDKVKELCTFIEPLIKSKLDKYQLSICIDEYLSDYLLTSNAKDSWLLSKKSIEWKSKSNEGLHYAKDDQGSFIITAPFVSSHNNRLSLLRGDRIVIVNGVPCSLLGGGYFTKILGNTMADSIAIEIERDSILFSTYWKNYPEYEKATTDSISINSDRILYYRFSELNSGVAENFESQIIQNQPLKGIILDLRNCGGGILYEAIEFVGLFLKKGDTICRIKYSDPLSNLPKIILSKKDNLINCKVVILTNSGTASAAEVIVSSLKTQRTITVIGRKTFGIGEINSGGKLALKPFYFQVKTGELLTADGKMISGNGIEPAIYVEDHEAIIQLAIKKINDKE
jgi:C-terminal peptidase prc